MQRPPLEYRHLWTCSPLGHDIVDARRTGGQPYSGFRVSLLHRIRIEPAHKRVRAVFAHTVVLDTARALVLHETGHAPRVYAPLEDYALEYFTKTGKSTHCPFKGEASYWSVRVGDRVEENVLWAYESPLTDVEQIAGHGALYADRMDAWPG